MFRHRKITVRVFTKASSIGKGIFVMYHPVPIVMVMTVSSVISTALRHFSWEGEGQGEFKESLPVLL